MNLLRFAPLLSILASLPAAAATYTVGPGGTYADLPTLFTAVDLEPGDIVEVSSNGSFYAGGIIMRAEDRGAPGNPVILRGVGSPRPHLRGGTNTIEFRSSNHVVMENFEISGSVEANTFRCVYHHAHDIVLRNVLVRDCPRHGVLGADQDSGSLTIEYSELRNSGSNGGNHLVYMATDEVAYPGAVFRLQYSYLHDSRFGDSGEGGNLVKSRAERNEIYYNWLEGAYYHELELIGPDPAGAQDDWFEDLAREDSDIVGNVIVHGSPDFGAVLRFGGDATGQSNGRYRFVNNTVVVTAPSAAATVFRLFDGIESLEAHNNVIWREGSGALRIIREVEAIWSTGQSRIAGSGNWIENGATFVPPGWGGSADPGFTNAAGFDFRPSASSPLLDSALAAPSAGSDYAIAAPLMPPTRHPPQRSWIMAGPAPLRPVAGALDIGAFEREDPNDVFADGFES